MPSSWIPLILWPTVLTINTLWLFTALGTSSDSIQCKRDPTGRHNSLTWHPRNQRLSPKNWGWSQAILRTGGSSLSKPWLWPRCSTSSCILYLIFLFYAATFKSSTHFLCWTVTFEFNCRSLNTQHTVVFSCLDLRYCYITLLSPFFFIFVCISAHLLFTLPRRSDFLSGMAQAVWWCLD